MTAPANCERLRVELYGAVQGVGFRPFVYRLATEMGLAGWVLNSAAGLVIETDGERRELTEFLRRLDAEKPAAAVVLTREISYLEPAGATGFAIVESDSAEVVSAGILPDLATCPQCLAELFDPANSRFGYPFTNCTSCGPTPSFRIFPTIGRGLRCADSSCARRAPESTTIPTTAVFTRSRMPVRFAGRRSMSTWLRPPAPCGEAESWPLRESAGFNSSWMRGTREL